LPTIGMMTVELYQRYPGMQMEDGTPYRKYDNGVYNADHELGPQDSARQPLPGQVGHCDYSSEGSDQV